MKYFALIFTVLIIGYGNLFGQTFIKTTTGAIVNDGGYSEGCSWADYDNDGDLDLFVANRLGQSNFLYENNGEGTFTKITSGIIVSDFANSIGNSWGDFDNDGDLDLFVSGHAGGNNLLYQNNGNKTFTKITAGTIVNDGGDSHCGSWGDYDNDGDLDMFVSNGGIENNFLYSNNGNGSFTKIIAGGIVNDGGWSHSCSWGDFDNDGDLDLFVANGYGENNCLYANNGNGTFTKITTSVIVNDGGNSHGCSWGDYDNDGDLDLFVANSYGENNFLYANNGDETFSKIVTGIIVNDGGDARGSSWGDYDNDGDLDLFVANVWGENNFLYTNNGDGTFIKVTTGVIVNDGGDSEACSWGDYDNDGDLDLFVANGGSISHENNFLYANNGNANSWLHVRCIGTVSNCCAIGTKVKVKATINGNAIWQMREISGLTGYASQNSPNVEFGLGDATIIDSIIVEWPSGIVQDTTNVSVNQFLSVEEDTTLVVNVNNLLSELPNVYVLEQNYPNPFNPSTTIHYTLPQSEFVTLKVYDIVGREVATLVNERKSTGNYAVNYDASRLSSGIYFYKIYAGSFEQVRKMVVMK